MKTRRWDLLAAALLFCVLGLLFVPECDDCYFSYWSFDSFWDFLLVQPSPSDPAVMGVPTNGRYLGNLLGLLLAKLAFTPLWWLRGLVMGGGLLALTGLLARHVRFRGAAPGEPFALALAMVLLAPVGIWQEVYSWGAAYMNYLAPMVLLLLLFRRLRRRDGAGWPVVLVMAAANCLFVENISLYLVLLGCGLLAASLRWPQRLPPRGLCAALCGGSWLGFGISMTRSVFSQVDSGLRGMGLELLHDNLPVIVTEVLLRPVVVTLLISGLLLWLVRRQGCPRWPLWGAALALFHLYLLFLRVQAARGALPLYRQENLLPGLALALLWLVLLWEWRGGAAKGHVLFYAASLCIVTGPMAVVSPLHSRMFFGSYLFLCLTAATLYRQARRQGVHALTGLRIPAFLAALVLVGIYACNAWVYWTRLSHACVLADAGATQITLPLVPFPQFTANEMIGKGDIVYQVYHQRPWDIGFTFEPYTKWKQSVS